MQGGTNALEPTLSTRRLTAAEAAEALGVKRATLYAYVSRGLLGRQPGEDGRSSTFDPVEVAQLSSRSRRRQGRSDLVIGSAISRLDEGRLSYRGRDVADLAVDHSYEAVVELLLAGRLEQRPLTSDPVAVAAGRGAIAALGPATTPAGRLLAALAAIASTDEYRSFLRASSVVETGRRLLPALVDALSPIDRSPGVGQPVAPRLWSALSAHKPTVSQIRHVDAALVLLADHGMATSTFAVRVAASVRADPYHAVAAGLAAVSGRLHGAASGPVWQLFEDVGHPTAAAETVRRLLDDGQRVRGFGHTVYEQGDPRASVLLDLLNQTVDDERLATVDAVLDAIRRQVDVEPNIDFALAAMCWIHRLGRDAGETIFAIARVAGWLAHALEEYDEQALRFRVRAVPLTDPPDAGD